MPIATCHHCGHSWLERSTSSSATPEILYDEDYAGYRDDPFFCRRAGEILEENVRSHVAPPAEILDVGCGNGAFLRVAKERGYRAVGYDISEAAVRLSRARGFEAYSGDLATLAGERVERFALATLWDVIEHVEEPARLLGQCSPLLKSRGHLLVKTPTLRCLAIEAGATLPRLSGAVLQTPGHIQLFTAESLSSLLDRTGFEVVELLPCRGLRTPGQGGGLRKWIGRKVTRTIHTLSGDGNAIVIAQKRA